MNNRIRELVIKANPASKEIYEANNWQYNCAAWDSNNLEKFAKLIVKECAHAIAQHNAKSYQVSQPFSIEQVLTKHFGVES